MTTTDEELAAFLRAELEEAQDRCRLLEERLRLRWSKAEYGRVYVRDEWTCQYCGEAAAEKLTIDHIVPRASEGVDAPSNLAVACFSCNLRKGPRTPEQAGMPLRNDPRGRE